MQGHGCYRPSPVSGKKNSVRAPDNWKGEASQKSHLHKQCFFLKHPGKSITNFPEGNFDMSGQLRDRLLACAVYTQQFILSMQLKMLLSHNNLHFWIPGPAAGKVLLLCTGHMLQQDEESMGWRLYFYLGDHKQQGLVPAAFSCRKSAGHR